MGNLRFQNALSKVPQNTPPIWFMRQAGRYHKHYQNLRAKHSFVELCKNPNLAAQVALGPIEDFDFDVAILFSDILFPLEALGMGLTYEPKPQLSFSLSKNTFSKLNSRNAVEQLAFQGEAMRRTRESLSQDKSLIGFIGGPWTLFTYAVEGSHQGGLKSAKTQIDLYQMFSEICIPLLIENIKLQLDGGAEVVMIFDTASGELSPQLFNTHVVPDIKRLANSFNGRVGYYSKLTTPYHFSDPFFKTGVLAGVGFDHRWDLSKVMSDFPGFVQGNFDQTLMFQEPKLFETTLEAYLSVFKASQTNGWVCGLGHGVLPETPEDNVRTFVKAVRSVFK